MFGLILLHLRGLVAKPLWNDEQWRAYWSSLDPSQFLAQLPGIPAPVGLGWLAIERVSIEIFGNSAWALRLPPILSIYVLALCTYLLGRYWLPWWMSLLIGAALLCNAPDLVYGLQVKEDVFVSTCAVLTVLLLAGCQPRGRHDCWALGPLRHHRPPRRVRHPGRVRHRAALRSRSVARLGEHDNCAGNSR